VEPIADWCTCPGGQPPGGRRAFIRTETNYFVASGRSAWSTSSLARDRRRRAGLLFVAATGTDVTTATDEDALARPIEKKDEFIALWARAQEPAVPDPERPAGDPARRRDASAVAQARDMMDRPARDMVRLIDDLLDVAGSAGTRWSCGARALLWRTSCQRRGDRPTRDRGGRARADRVAPTARVLDADFTRLAQVFQHLLDSAKSTPSRGGASGSLPTGAAASVVEVRDTGSRIPAESLPRIFDMSPRWTGASSVPRRTRIGLALVKAGRDARRDRHGRRATDRAWAAPSACGSRGVAVDGPSPRAAREGRPDSGTKRRISLSTTTWTRPARWPGCSSCSGTSARGTRRRRGPGHGRRVRPEFILMDLGMPRLNGFETAAACAHSRGQSSRSSPDGWGRRETRPGPGAASTGTWSMPVNSLTCKASWPSWTGGSSPVQSLSLVSAAAAGRPGRSPRADGRQRRTGSPRRVPRSASSRECFASSNMFSGAAPRSRATGRPRREEASRGPDSWPAHVEDPLEHLLRLGLAAERFLVGRESSLCAVRTWVRRTWRGAHAV